MMVKAGTWGEDAAQLHRFFGWNKIGVSFKVPFSVKADDCYCTENEMSWNLKIDKKVAFNVGYGYSDKTFVCLLV